MSEGEPGDQSPAEAATAWPRRTVRIAASLIIVVGSVVGVAAASFLADIAATGCFWSCSQEPDPGAAATFLVFACVFLALAAWALAWGATQLRARTAALRVGVPTLVVAATLAAVIVVSI